jgi:serralysin
VLTDSSYIANVFGDAERMDGHTWGGNDTITADHGRIFSLYGDAKTMTDKARGGDDIISSLTLGFTVNSTSAYGDAEALSGDSRGGNDSIMGSRAGSLVATNTLYGDGSLSDKAKGGNDTVVGGSSDQYDAGVRNILYGDGSLSDKAMGGDDTVIGGSSTLRYDSARNTLYGDGSLSDTAKGGNDVLISGTGAPDQMWGDGEKLGLDVKTGSDRFVFAPGNGVDVIGDFESGKDDIDLTAFGNAGIHSFDDLTLALTDMGTVIDFGSDNSVTVLGVTALSETDLIFA